MMLRYAIHIVNKISKLLTYYDVEKEVVCICKTASKNTLFFDETVSVLSHKTLRKIFISWET